MHLEISREARDSRPWLDGVRPSEARFSIESAGNVASLMLDNL